jgi:glucosamine--fructose-6-phosphate aminotransferase (isomerizing)
MPAAEMKHGPIALINEGMPVVFIATRGTQYEKVISNIEEVRARGGQDHRGRHRGRHLHPPPQRPRHLRPDTHEPLQPLLSVVPLQLIATTPRSSRGCNVDKPRNWPRA